MSTKKTPQPNSVGQKRRTATTPTLTKQLDKRGSQRLEVDLDSAEIGSRVCNLVCAGKSIREVQKELESGRPKISLTRQQPYEILRKAAKLGRLRYIAPIESDLSASLKRQYDWLHSTDVVHTAELGDIAAHAADKLLQLIAGSRARGGPKNEFHIGFAGGGLLQHTARLLAEELRRTNLPLPKTIFFHSMVARFDEDPASDPNSFVGYLNSGPPLPVAVRFIGLMAPGMVDVQTAEQLRRTEGIHRHGCGNFSVRCGRHRGSLLDYMGENHTAHPDLYRGQTPIMML